MIRNTSLLEQLLCFLETGVTESECFADIRSELGEFGSNIFETGRSEELVVVRVGDEGNGLF